VTGTLLILGFGACAALALGVADFFGAQVSKTTGPITAAFFVQSVGTAAFAVWFLFSGNDFPTMTAATWLYVLTGALLMGAGMCTLYLAFERGPVSLASPLSAAYPLVTAAVGVLFFGAALTLAEGAAVVIIVAGIMAASGMFGVARNDRRISAGPRLALLTTVLWGIAYPLLGQAVEAAGWEAVTLVQLAAMVPALGVMLASRRQQEGLTRVRAMQTLRSPLAIAAGVLQMLAVLAINVGFGLDQAAGTMVVTTSAAYPVVTMLLALRHFDEHTDKLALVGAGVTVAGVLALHTL
jgi:drug/metabolite transporter (DMT)-like permease